MFRTRALYLPLALVFAALTAVSAQGQFYKLHQLDLSVGGTGQFTTAVTNGNGNHAATLDSPGFLLSMREHPVAWAGIELNYGYNRFSERFTPLGGSTFTDVKTNVHEATAAYMFHPHFRHLQPFVNVGGGALGFDPPSWATQWRGAGLTEVGLDVPTSNPHFGFRVQGRGLIYRGPNFYNKAFGTSKWVVTSEPSVSAFVRF